jgi:hypothetical protein
MNRNRLFTQRDVDFVKLNGNTNVAYILSPNLLKVDK